MNTKKIGFSTILITLVLIGTVVAIETNTVTATDYVATRTTATNITTAGNSPLPPIECKKYVDDDGCTVKVCSSGREERYCHDEISCEKEVNEDGCVIEKCSDGSSTRHCPNVTSSCQKTINDRGCTVMKCSDGTEETYCSDVECKRYVDDDGCTVKHCTGGTKDRDCPETDCPTEGEIDEKEDACREKGLRALLVHDSQGCKNIKCVGDCSITEDEADERIRKCKAYGLSYKITFDEKSCKNVACHSLQNAGIAIAHNVNCKEEKDDTTGFVRRICERVCEEISSEKKLRCIDAGGTPVVQTDRQGCNYIKCDFPETDADDGTSDCVPIENLHEVEKECKERGLVPKYAHDLTGCRKVECVEEKERGSCGRIPLDELRGKKSACAGRGGRLLEEFDSTGCPSFVCRNPDETCEEIPEEAYSKCEEVGGTLVVKKNEGDCVVYSECLKRGVEPAEAEVKHVLGLERIRALIAKLDRIMEELGKLEEKALGIAEYYKEQGAEEKAGKFEKAARMIKSAMERVSELKEKLESNAENMDVETLKEIKNKLRHLKEVVLKDIIYVMLSQEKTGADKEKCNDIDCFKKALRICKKNILEDSSEGATVSAEITGFESGACRFKVKIKKQGGEEMEMDCEEPNHAFADFESGHLSKICTGTLAETLKNMKKHTPTVVRERRNE